MCWGGSGRGLSMCCSVDSISAVTVWSTYTIHTNFCTDCACMAGTAMASKSCSLRHAARPLGEMSARCIGRQLGGSSMNLGITVVPDTKVDAVSGRRRYREGTACQTIVSGRGERSVLTSMAATMGAPASPALEPRAESREPRATADRTSPQRVPRASPGRDRSGW